MAPSELQAGLILWSRMLRWGSASTKDVTRFPARDVAPSSAPRRLGAPPSDDRLCAAVGDQWLEANDFRRFLDSNQTTSFLVLQGGDLLFEHYGNGGNRDGLVGCFSVSKSIISALVGLAIADGVIRSLDDYLTDYLPDLSEAWAAGVTLRHPLTMTCGLNYSDAPVPWSQGARLYHTPNRWAKVLRIAQRINLPGSVWFDNDFSPALIEAVLREVTGKKLAHYAETRLFQPLGMERAANWTLDREDGVEDAASGLFCTAHTLAQFGQLYLDGGQVGNRQILSENFVAASTRIEPSDPPAIRAVIPAYIDAPSMAYKNYWWLQSGKEGDWNFAAIGVLGQYIYVCPKSRIIVVRTGHGWGRFGNTAWFKLLGDIAGSERAIA